MHVPTAAETRLENYLAAEAKILRGQRVRFGERDLQYADLEQVRAEIKVLQVQVAREAAAVAGRGGRFSQANFGDCP